MEDTDSAGVVSKTSGHGVRETVGMLTEILGENGLRVFSVIDQREAAESVGLTLRETTLVVFGSPRAGTPVMVATPLSALDLPLKVLVWDDGGTTRITYESPSVIAERRGIDPGLAENLNGIHVVTDMLVDAAK